MADQEANLKLVAEVEKHEVLYNFTLPAYSRKDVTEKAWQEVAARVNLSAAECKDKWRNLRTVFRRKTKCLPSGSRGKKAYYLENAMQFCLPFLRTTGNLPGVPPHSTGDDEISRASQVESTLPEQTTQSPSPIYPEVSLLEPNLSEHSQQKGDTPVQFSSPTAFKKRFKERNKSDADQCAIEYFKVKKPKILQEETETSSQKIDRQQSLKMFLLSLIPELEELSDSQIKLFKRQVFGNIDKISTYEHLTKTSTSSTQTDS